MSKTNHGSDLFKPTRWSVVLAAVDSGSGPGRHAALAELCETYWRPVFIYLRRKGYTVHEAEDLTQGFFMQLLEKKRYTVADPERGRFRAFMITALKNYLINTHEREQALKRGGGKTIISLDSTEVERHYSNHALSNTEPEAAFDREWAQTVVGVALETVRRDYISAGKESLFAHFEDSVSGKCRKTQAELALQLSMNENAVKSALQRIRKRFRIVLRQEIAEAANSPNSQEIDAEIQYLMSCLNQSHRA